MVPLSVRQRVRRLTLTLENQEVQQRFSTQLNKQEEELRQIAELKERFEIQSDNLQSDKKRILNILQRV